MLVQREKEELVPREEEKAYSNFVNSINSDATRHSYEYSLGQFLKRYQLNLDSFLRLEHQEMSNIIAKYLVEAHDGKIWAESEIGRGTTISFTLPV